MVFEFANHRTLRRAALAAVMLASAIDALAQTNYARQTRSGCVTGGPTSSPSGIVVTTMTIDEICRLWRRLPHLHRQSHVAAGVPAASSDASSSRNGHTSSFMSPAHAGKLALTLR